MDKSFFVFECKSEQEYGEILAILAMHEIKASQITDQLSKLSPCVSLKENVCQGCDKLFQSGSINSDKPGSPVFVDLSSAKVKSATVLKNETTVSKVGEPLYVKTGSYEEPSDGESASYESDKVVDIYREIDSMSHVLEAPKQNSTHYVASRSPEGNKGKRRRRDATLKKFHEFIIELLLDSRYEHLIHVSGSVKNNFIQFTIPDRRKFATVWGMERGDSNYSSTSLVNKDFWNAQKAEIFSRVLFQDPMLVYKIEPKAEARFSRILSERNLTMASVLQFCRQRLIERGNI